MNPMFDQTPADNPTSTDLLRGYVEQVVVDPRMMEAHLAWLRTQPAEWTEQAWINDEEVGRAVREGLAGLAEEVLARLAMSRAALGRVHDGVLGQFAAPPADTGDAWDDAFLRLGERLENVSRQMDEKETEKLRTANALRRPCRWPAPWTKRAWWAGVAAAVLVCVFFGWQYRVVAAEKEKFRQEAEKAKRQMQELKDAGYLDPFGADILVAPPDRLVIAGWAHPGVIERVEVYWSDAADAKVEILYQAREGSRRNEGRRVTFSGSHAYQLGGATVKPRVHAVPFQDSEEVLKELHKGDPPLEVTKPFGLAPQGIIAEDAAAPLSDTQAASWVLERGGSVEVLVPSREVVSVTRPGDLPKGSFTVHGVKLSEANVRITDADFRRLCGLRMLRSLDASKTGLTDAGLHEIKELTALKDLVLVDCAVSDTGLKAIQSLQALERLDLQHTNVSDAGLAYLKALPNIRWLSLWETKVTDAGLAHLGGTITLFHLRLGGKGITDKGVEHLKGLTNLKTLYMGTSGVGDAGVAHLKGLGALEELGLDRTEITDAGLEHLGGMRKLKYLKLGECRISDEGLAHLERLPGLTGVYLNGTKVTATGVEKLKKALGSQVQIHH